jgi:hypothetical protein
VSILRCMLRFLACRITDPDPGALQQVRLSRSNAHALQLVCHHVPEFQWEVLLCQCHEATEHELGRNTPDRHSSAGRLRPLRWTTCWH